MKTSSNPRRTFVVRLVSLAALASAAVTVAVPEHAAAADAARMTQHHRSANAVVHWNTIAGEASAPKASAEAAVAASAREVLVKLVPEQAARVEAAYGEALAAVRDGPAKT